MAGPYNCDVCGQNEAAVVLGLISTGDQQFLCPTCYGMQGLIAAKETLEPQVIAELLGPMFVEGAAKGAAPPKRARKGSERPQEASEPVERPKAPPGLEEAEAAAQD